LPDTEIRKESAEPIRKIFLSKPHVAAGGLQAHQARVEAPSESENHLIRGDEAVPEDRQQPWPPWGGSMPFALKNGRAEERHLILSGATERNGWQLLYSALPYL
jgi:hypothetical protein